MVIEIATIPVDNYYNAARPQPYLISMLLLTFTSRARAFWRGVGSTLDVTGNVDQLRQMNVPDSEALRSDWQAVGTDLGRAMEMYRAEVESIRGQLSLFNESAAADAE